MFLLIANVNSRRIFHFFYSLIICWHFNSCFIAFKIWFKFSWLVCFFTLLCYIFLIIKSFIRYILITFDIRILNHQTFFFLFILMCMTFWSIWFTFICICMCFNRFWWFWLWFAYRTFQCDLIIFIIIIFIVFFLLFLFRTWLLF